MERQNNIFKYRIIARTDKATWVIYANYENDRLVSIILDNNYPIPYISYYGFIAQVPLYRSLIFLKEKEHAGILIFQEIQSDKYETFSEDIETTY